MKTLYVSSSLETHPYTPPPSTQPVTVIVLCCLLRRVLG
jgi:hypothetical protein